MVADSTQRICQYRGPLGFARGRLFDSSAVPASRDGLLAQDDKLGKWRWDYNARTVAAAPSLRSGFRLRAPAPLTPAKRLNLR